jgi:chemotaxis signal transduction protein
LAETAKVSGEPGGQAIVVRLGPGRFAVPVDHVAEVGRVPVMTRVPGLPSWLAGAANWRGRILPVLDLRQLLGAHPGGLERASRVLVLASVSATVGLLVDEVVETTDIAVEEVAPFPATLPVAAAGLLAGQVAREDGPVAVLDFDALMRLRESLPRGRRIA